MSESIRQTNPDWHFVIGLVDKNTHQVDLSLLNCEIIEVEKIKIEGFDTMVARYSIVELLTATKPFYIEWLFDNYQADNVIYLDPDIMIFQPLTSLEKSLSAFDIILTPHFTTPISDNCLPTELHVMQTGIYNLGFIAVKRSANTFSMLRWWQNRLQHLCVIDLSRGLFVDQLWANLIPTYFDKVLIEKYPGYNMAHWNLHERFLTKKEEFYFVNDVPLIFFHFSHFSPLHPNAIAAHHNRFNFKDRPDLIELFKLYASNLLQYHYKEFKSIKCFYMHDEQKKKRKRAIESFLRTALPDKLKGRVKRLTGK